MIFNNSILSQVSVLSTGALPWPVLLHKGPRQFLSSQCLSSNYSSLLDSALKGSNHTQLSCQKTAQKVISFYWQHQASLRPTSRSPLICIKGVSLATMQPHFQAPHFTTPPIVYSTQSPTPRTVPIRPTNRTPHSRPQLNRPLYGPAEQPNPTAAISQPTTTRDSLWDPSQDLTATLAKFIHSTAHPHSYRLVVNNFVPKAPADSPATSYSQDALSLHLATLATAHMEHYSLPTSTAISFLPAKQQQQLLHQLTIGFAMTTSPGFHSNSNFATSSPPASSSRMSKSQAYILLSTQVNRNSY